MTPGLGIAALLATIALGFVAGFFHLQKAHKPLVVRAHLLAALAALAVVAGTIATATRSNPGGPDGLVPLVMVGIAVAAGYGAFRLRGVGRGGRKAMLIGHLVVGIASFFVLLAWAKHF